MHPYFQKKNQYNSRANPDQYWDGFQWVTKTKEQLENEQQQTGLIGVVADSGNDPSLEGLSTAEREMLEAKKLA